MPMRCCVRGWLIAEASAASAVKSTPVAAAMSVRASAAVPGSTMKSPGMGSSPPMAAAPSPVTRRTEAPAAKSMLTALNASLSDPSIRYPRGAADATIPAGSTGPYTAVRSASTAVPTGSTLTPMNSAITSADMSYGRIGSPDAVRV